MVMSSQTLNRSVMLQCLKQSL